jgi:hypothetical protein
MNEERMQQVLKALEGLKLRMLLTQNSIKDQNPAGEKIMEDIRNGLGSDACKLEIFTDIASKGADAQSIIAADDEVFAGYPVKNDTVYFSIGRVNRNAVARFIVQSAGDIPGISYDADDSSIALFSFRTDLDGKYIDESFSLSGLLWAASEFRKNDTGVLNVSNYENAVKDYEEIIQGQNVRDFLYAICSDAYDKYVSGLFGSDGGAFDGFWEYNRYTHEQALNDDQPYDYSLLEDSNIIRDTDTLAYLIGSGYFGDGSRYEEQVIEYILSGCDRYVFDGMGGRISVSDAFFARLIEKALVIADCGDEPDSIFQMHSFKDGPLKARGNAYSEFAPHYYSIYDERIAGSSIMTVSGDINAAEDIAHRISAGEGLPGEICGDDGTAGVDSADGLFAGYAEALYGSGDYRGLFCAPIASFRDKERYCREVLLRYCTDYGNIGIKEEHKKLFVSYRREFIRQYEKLSSVRQRISPEQYESEKGKLFESACRMLQEFAASSKYLKLNIINLMIAWGMYDKCSVKMSDADKEAAMPYLLQSLFLLTPLISTTYSGIRNLFGDISSPGVLGTLLVSGENRGQSQTEIGAMFRCRNVIFTS